MMKITPCTPPPFNAAGIEVKALYFSQSPGEKFISVYARYREGQSWAPLHIGLPSIPTLQQVRDLDRNISLDSGSYNNAHIYLRSAAGNNMTTALYTNEEGGGIQVGNVDGVSALNLQPEGGILTYGGAEVATRQWVEQYALTFKNMPVTNFNAVITQGIYTINSGLTTIANYPNIGGNNNGSTGGYLVVYGVSPNTIQYFYPINESFTINRSGGYWYRRSVADVWEYKDGILEINLNNAPVQADNLIISGEYLVTTSFSSTFLQYGYPHPGTYGAIPLMITVRKRWGNVSWNYAITQEAVCIQESPGNFTRKWIRSRFNWRPEGNPWDTWNEVALLRDVYSKGQLQTSGSSAVHWNNITNKPTIVDVETDPLYTASIPDQLMVKGYLAANENLNNYLTTGVWMQSDNAQAASGSNYPIAQAGKLEVVTGGGFTYQTYHTYAENNISYYRSYWTTSGWSSWERVMTNAEVLAGTGFLYSNGAALSFDNSIFIKASINWGPDMASVLQNSIVYHNGGEPDNPSGGSTGYSINGGAGGGISSVQLFLATGNTSGVNPDGFYWRGNNAGGVGWPGPWRQVASREWVAANFISLSNVINAQYASAQNANFWISGSARAQHFVANSLGYAMTAHSGYYGFFTDTGSSTALPIKAKEMVLSDSYSDVAPTNGLFVKGNLLLKPLEGVGKRKVIVNASGVLEAAPLHGSGSTGTIIGTNATGIDIDLIGVCDESCGRLIITNTTVADISNVQIFVEYGTPYESEAKATFSPSNEVAATTDKVYLMNNDRTGFTLAIPLIHKAMALSYDYNVVGY